MTIKATYISIIAMAFTVLLLAACTTTTTSDQSGFLGKNLDYKPAADGSGAETYLKLGVTSTELEKYSKVMIDPVTLWYSPKSEFKGIFPSETKEIADYLRDKTITAFKDKYELVDQPGPDVMHLRIAITNLDRRNPLHIYEFTPVGAMVYGAITATGVTKVTKEKLLKHDSYIIDATIEAGYYDSVSGKLLEAYLDKISEDDKNNTDKSATWGQIKTALDEWAQDLRKLLDTNSTSG